jgi:hypothetical protein
LVNTYDIKYLRWRKTNDESDLKQTYENIKKTGDIILNGVGLNTITNMEFEKDYKGNKI